MNTPSSTCFSLLALLLILCCSPVHGVSAQEEKLPKPEPYFAALIVSDLEISNTWYQSTLGFEVITTKAMPEYGFEQTNLTNGAMNLELIQLQSAVSPNEAIPNYSAKTRLQGIFKIGLQVQQFDKWMVHLQKLEVRFHGDVVTDPVSAKRMVIILDPDGNRIQLFER